MLPKQETAQSAGVMSVNRPAKSTTFFALANVWKTRSTCMRGQVGCVIVNDDGYVLTSGYNGAPRGLPHCYEVGCLMDGAHCVRAIHAEMNAVIQAARQGVSLVGATVYTTKRPCLRCVSVLIQAGIASILYLEAYDTDDQCVAQDLCRAAGVEMMKWS